jgi:hypothetical protein
MTCYFIQILCVQSGTSNKKQAMRTNPLEKEKKTKQAMGRWDPAAQSVLPPSRAGTTTHIPPRNEEIRNEEVQAGTSAPTAGSSAHRCYRPSTGQLPDEDIASIDTTDMPTAPQIQGPITRARAEPLNYHVLSFHGTIPHIHYKKVLIPNVQFSSGMAPFSSPMGLS